MAKTYTITLGGKEWPLRYRPADAIELKRRFGKPLTTLLRQDVMGFEERPRLDGAPGDTHWVSTGTADLEVQIAFLAVGIRDDKGEPSEAKVLGWVTEMMAAGQNFSPLAVAVWKAACVSGITGTSFDPEAPEAEGKA